ncbi:MBL fold metallo-hydrolase, partial [Variovorax sp. GT1P44]
MRTSLLASAALAPGIGVCGGTLTHPALAGYSYLEANSSRADDEPSLHATFFGTTTIVLSDRTQAVITDGFITRPGYLQILFGRIAPDAALIEKVLDASGVTKLHVQAILVAHSHFDHALDAPVVAMLTGAKLVGTESTRNIAAGQHFNGAFVVAGNGMIEPAGAFTIKMLRSLHSSPATAMGSILAPLEVPARAS